jgi:hypothetical protein
MADSSGLALFVCVPSEAHGRGYCQVLIAGLIDIFRRILSWR